MIAQIAQTALQPLATRAPRLREFLLFGFKELEACVFAGSFLALLTLSSWLRVPGLARYDLLFLGAIAIQLAMIALRLETWREVAMLSLFHLLGTLLELFKTSPMVGSWAYPEPAFFRIGSVPLYAGFMYAAIASYMIQAWRLLDVRLTSFPPLWLAFALALAIYANFFSNHWIVDLRWPLIALVLLVFRKSWVEFRPAERVRRMPVALSFLLIGFFVWVAENIGTFFGAWVYPHQRSGWAIVGPAKISSWALLVILSFVIVAAVKQLFPRERAP
ncbi:DUF817 domain-containing protein [Roseiterribacter gracilis]|uniref:Membrane protein n=1 Tax=Roseiterribacter gracilis TaxID=2812848 RepID=A0A8S8XAL6_9PROT|nr:membrane protein [Rhodospirillales bacterium TMPK1]